MFMEETCLGGVGRVGTTKEKMRKKEEEKGHKKEIR